MALSVVDASIVIAVLDPRDAHHGAAREALETYAGDDLRMVATTLAEVLVHPARDGRDREARRLISALEIAVEPVDEAVALSAARLRAAHGPSLRLPDAIVLAYAEVARARRVLTTDARWPRWSRRAEVVGV